MAWKPSPALVCRAMDLYLRCAYDGPLPSAVRAKTDTLRSLPENEFYESPIFECDGQRPPCRFAIRLGNQFYPHMKLAILRSPDGHGYLLRADTHDAHIRPNPNSRELAAFNDLMDRNRAIARRIEAAWGGEHLPTFNTFLREDLARRGSGGEGAGGM